MLSQKIDITLEEGAIAPFKAHLSDAGFDLFANADVIIDSGSRAIVSTGVKMAIPAGHVGIVKSRSGLAAKSSVDAKAGVIDSGYRGDVGVVLANNSDIGLQIKKGDKIAQILIIPVPDFEMNVVEELSEADRGDNGYGSTGY